MVNGNKNKYKALGLMSGSSLDGLDVVYCEFEKKDNGKWLFNIINADTFSYSEDWLDKLNKASRLSGKELIKLHIEYGQFLGDVSHDFIIKNGLLPDFIASHGHTVFHEPKLGFTFQLGEGQSLSSISGYTVVNDFRTKDVAHGGQGAPLVPIGDKYLFVEYDFCLNLGGIANISFNRDNQRLAFDICPVNQLLNYLSNQVGLPYDDEGNIARTGKINNNLLSQLDKDLYYIQAPPKSLSNAYVFNHFIKLIDNCDDKLENKLRTVNEHIAGQISNAILTKSGKLLVTGGGAYNSFLIGRLTNLIPNEIILPPKQIIDFKEALIFAFLGVLRMGNEINCLSSVTGAKEDCSGGVIFHP